MAGCIFSILWCFGWSDGVCVHAERGIHQAWDKLQSRMRERED